MYIQRLFRTLNRITVEREYAISLCLLRVEVGAESEVLETLRKADAVEEAHRIYGIYDAVAKIRVDTMDKLEEIVTSKVRRIEKVQSTITLLVIE